MSRRSQAFRGVSADVGWRYRLAQPKPDGRGRQLVGFSTAPPLRCIEEPWLGTSWLAMLAVLQAVSSTLTSVLDCRFSSFSCLVATLALRHQHTPAFAEDL